MFIYIIENKKSRTVYVGQTISQPSRRWAHHRCLLLSGKHENPRLQRAWDKHGADDFQFKVVGEASTQDELNEMECAWIEYLTMNHRVYNLRDGGSTGALSDATRKKMSDAQRGRTLSESHRAKLREAWKTRPPHSDITKKKMSQSNTGKKRSEHTKQRMIEAKRHKARALPPLVAPDGTVYTGEAGSATFCRTHGLHPWGLHSVLNGTYTHHKGWRLATPLQENAF